MPRWLEAFPKASAATLETAGKHAPGAALVWLRLDEEKPAFQQLAALRKNLGDARVIVLANRPDNEQALTLFSAGIRGYCNAHSTAANLRQVAAAVQAGGLWIGEALMQRLVASTQAALLKTPGTIMPPDGSGLGGADCFSTLTEREREVARAVARGASNKEIARHLGITERTVKAHVGSVFQKLNARDRLHLALMVTGQRPS